MTDKEFDNYCSKLKKKLCKSIAADLDFYDFKDTQKKEVLNEVNYCLLYTSPSPRDATLSRMPSSA